MDDDGRRDGLEATVEGGDLRRVVLGGTASYSEGEGAGKKKRQYHAVEARPRISDVPPGEAGLR